WCSRSSTMAAWISAMAARPRLASCRRTPPVSSSSTARVGMPLRLSSAASSRLPAILDRKSTRLNSSHVKISYAVFCLKKKSGACYLFSLLPRATPETFTLSLHDALPILVLAQLDDGRLDLGDGRQAQVGFLQAHAAGFQQQHGAGGNAVAVVLGGQLQAACDLRSEEHTSELQSRENLVCRLLLEKKKRCVLSVLFAS